MKVNLKEIQSRLVKRGRDAYENAALVAELVALDPSAEGDAFLFEEATYLGECVSTNEEYTNHKNTWRNRVNSLAARHLGDEVELSVQWTDSGEMIVSFRK